MNIQRWVARREISWKQLEALLKQVETKGLQSLQAQEISTLAGLYRSVCGDLARARTHRISETLIKELQMLTSRSYSQIYQGSRRQEGESILEFYRWKLPEVIRTTLPYTLIATGFFAMAGLIGWWYSYQDPGFMSLLLPQSMITLVRDKGELWMGRILADQPGSSTGIMINNMSVCFRTVAGGVTAGLYTLYVLFLNGLWIGTISALVGLNNLAVPFWAFVFPHGALELPAIFISGGAGLLIARALLWPGRYRRSDALRKFGGQAAQLMFGIVPMLIFAGLIEGFLSPSPIVPEVFKYATGIGLFVYFWRYCQRVKPKTINPS